MSGFARPRPHRGGVRFVGIGAVVAGLLLTGCSQQSQQAQPLPTKSVDKSITLAAIEPDDGPKPVTDFIDGAKQSVDMVMYEFYPTYKPVVDALLRAKNRGVNVRILLSRQIFGEPVNNHNLANRKTLLKLGLNTQLSRPEFSYSHEKTYIRDAGTGDALAFVADFNVDTSYFEFAADPADANPNELGTRGMAALVTDAADVADIAATFDADWPPYRVWPPAVRPNLVWAPGDPSFKPTGNSITAMNALFAGAQQSLDVYVQALAYPSMMFQPLLDRAKAGVKVRIIGNVGGINDDAAAQLRAAGVDIVANPRLAGSSTDYLYIHTKTIIADAGTSNQVVFLGSENPFLDQSLQTERELGVLMTDTESVKKVVDLFNTDFGRSIQYPTRSPSPSPTTTATPGN
ncbi:MAG: phospholipase D-like domain-containing protein [Candidatus Nanopelagicales bacterium]